MAKRIIELLRSTIWQLPKQWYQRSLANKLATLMLGVSALAVISIATASLWIAFNVIQKKEEALLQKDVAVAGSRLSMELNNMIDELTVLARNPILVNGLTDGAEAKVYLAALLNEFRFRQIGSTWLAVYDYRARPLLSNRGDTEQLSTAAELTNQLDGPAMSARIVQVAGRWQLLLVHAIAYPDSNANQGFLVADIPLDLVLAEWLAPDRDPRTWALQFTQNEKQYKASPLYKGDARDLAFNAALAVKEPLSNFNLVLQMHEADRGAIEALQYLVPIFISLVLLALLTAWVFSLQLGRRLAQPIVALADRAKAVTQTQQFAQALPV